MDCDVAVDFRVFDWQDRTHEDALFGPVVGRMRWVGRLPSLAPSSSFPFRFHSALRNSISFPSRFFLCSSINQPYLLTTLACLCRRITTDTLPDLRALPPLLRGGWTQETRRCGVLQYQYQFHRGCSSDVATERSWVEVGYFVPPFILPPARRSPITRYSTDVGH